MRNLFKLDTSRLSGAFVVHFEQILHIALVFPLVTMNKQIPSLTVNLKEHLVSNSSTSRTFCVIS